MCRCKISYFCGKTETVRLLEKIDIRDYHYLLPDDRIAKYPLEQRDQSKLLIYKNGTIKEDHFKSLPNHLPYPCDLYLNNTRVIHARLRFQRSTGATIEVFCLAPYKPSDYQLAFSSEHSCVWKCMVGNLKKWKDETIELNSNIDNHPVGLLAEKIKVEREYVLVRFTWNRGLSFGQIIDRLGKVPIPPYLNRDSESIDDERYQTIYSQPEGSVAAPTAGLHFTPEVFTSLQRKSILMHEITLHVGAGTFQPVKCDNALDHPMHSEFFTVDYKIIERLATSGSPVISAGTTTLRALESLYWLAVKSITENKICTNLGQWEYSDLPASFSSKQAFTQLLELMASEKSVQFNAETSIMIVPGYEFRVVEGLITNFHQPESTLLLLVAAFIGQDWKKVYEYALANNFRFLSYGDSSLLLK
jgi:S-adenosylmethionine:tRNA ribosyltransferase-isomerase